jgi:hypothetical protein
MTDAPRTTNIRSEGPLHGEQTAAPEGAQPRHRRFAAGAPDTVRSTSNRRRFDGQARGPVHVAQWWGTLTTTRLSTTVATKSSRTHAHQQHAHETCTQQQYEQQVYELSREHLLSSAAPASEVPANADPAEHLANVLQGRTVAFIRTYRRNESRKVLGLSCVEVEEENTEPSGSELPAVAPTAAVAPTVERRKKRTRFPGRTQNSSQSRTPQNMPTPATDQSQKMPHSVENLHAHKVDEGHKRRKDPSCANHFIASISESRQSPSQITTISSRMNAGTGVIAHL